MVVCLFLSRELIKCVQHLKFCGEGTGKCVLLCLFFLYNCYFKGISRPQWSTGMKCRPRVQSMHLSVHSVFTAVSCCIYCCSCPVICRLKSVWNCEQMWFIIHRFGVFYGCFAPQYINKLQLKSSVLFVTSVNLCISLKIWWCPSAKKRPVVKVQSNKILLLLQIITQLWAIWVFYYGYQPKDFKYSFLIC